MNFEPADYYHAALERLKQSQDYYRKDSKEDHSTNHHPLAFYTCGVAVECMLRAFITLKSKEFDSRHDLKDLLDESGLLEIKQATSLGDEDLVRIKIELGGAVSHVNRLWNNSLRYASEARLRSYLHEMKFDRGIKGDAPKENLKRLLNSSIVIINRGTRIWDTLKS